MSNCHHPPTWGTIDLLPIINAEDKLEEQPRRTPSALLAYTQLIKRPAIFQLLPDSVERVSNPLLCLPSRPRWHCNRPPRLKAAGRCGRGAQDEMPDPGIEDKSVYLVYTRIIRLLLSLLVLWDGCAAWAFKWDVILLPFLGCALDNVGSVPKRAGLLTGRNIEHTPNSRIGGTHRLHVRPTAAQRTG